MVVGIGGQLGDGLLERIEELLGDLPDAETGEPERGRGPSRTGRRASSVHTKQSDQAHVCLGVHSYPLEHPDRYPLQILANVLGGGMSSRLFTEVRERRGLAYYVFGINHSYTDAGSLYAQAGVDIQRIDEAVTTIASELRKVAEEGIPQDELDKTKSFAKGRFVLQLESPHGLIDVRAAARGARGQDARPGGDRRRARQGDRRGRRSGSPDDLLEQPRR